MLGNRDDLEIIKTGGTGIEEKNGFWSCTLLLLAGGACAVRKISRIPVPVSCYIYDQCGGCSVTDHPCNACTGERQYRIKMESVLEEGGVRDQVELKIYNVLYSFTGVTLQKPCRLPVNPLR